MANLTPPGAGAALPPHTPDHGLDLFDHPATNRGGSPGVLNGGPVFHPPKPAGGSSINPVLKEAESLSTKAPSQRPVDQSPLKGPGTTSPPSLLQKAEKAFPAQALLQKALKAEKKSHKKRYSSNSASARNRKALD